MAQDFNEMLEKVGSYGPYQKWRIILILVPVSFFVAFTMNVLLFQTVVPEHWCHVPGRQNTTLSLEEWKALTVPRSKESDKYESCLMYEMESGDVDGTNFTASNVTQACSSGWEHDNSQFSATVATSFDWLCERAKYSHHVLSVSLAGNTVGTFLMSFLADKHFGRRLVFYMMLVIYIVSTLIVVWVSDFVIHLILRFIQGLSCESNYLLPYVIVLEIIPPEQRAFATMLTFLTWTLGMCFTSLLAWLLPHWQYLALISCLPSLLGFLYWRYLPESPRWLLTKGRVQECADILLQVAAANGKSGVSRVELESELKQLSMTQPKDLPVTHAFIYPKLRLRAVLLFIMSFCCFIINGIVLLGINVMPSNYFLSHFILSVFKLPSNFLGSTLVDYLGRRVVLWVSFLFVGIFCIAASFCTHSEWLLLSMVAMVKLFVMFGMYVIFVTTSEIFPTPIRTSGIGCMIVFGMAAMAVTPYILYSGVSSTFHYWMMLGFALLSLLASLPLPETLGLHLPQTFQEAEDLGSSRPLTAWIHHWNKDKYPPQTSKLPSDSGQQQSQ